MSTNYPISDSQSICTPALCTGCAACANVCPVSCITMQPDEEGFLRPQIDESRCFHCHLCERRCPVNNPASPRTPLTVYAAQAKDLPIRLASSSGGIFTLLARQILAKGGVVYGVAWDIPNYGAKFAAARNEEELAALRGSKYVQAVVGSTYRDIKAFLDAQLSTSNPQPFLFSGTPCQIAALRSVLGKDYDNLLTVEVICHAVPSPLAFRHYIEEREQKAGSKIARISCRSKNCSWTRFAQALEFHSTACAYLRPFYRDPYLRGFIHDVYNRPSCTQCSFKNFRSGADITLGDYWGIKKVIPSLYDDRGTSAVLVNTTRGASAFAALASELNLAPSTFQDVVQFNPALVKSTPPSKNRALFFGRLPHAKSFDKLSLSLSRLPVKFWVFLFLGFVKRKIAKKLSENFK